jgi:hypothetical protein
VRAMVWVLLVVVGAVIEAELIAWCRPLQRWLIRRAAAPLPREHRARYIEEWYRELDEVPDGPVTRLWWVLHLVLRRCSLARSLGRNRSRVIVQAMVLAIYFVGRPFGLPRIWKRK